MASGYGAVTPRNLAIVLWSTEPDSPHRCATPFSVAAAAAAMDAQVEVFFSAASVRLLVRSCADEVFPGLDRQRPLSQFMLDARGQGVRFLVCAASLEGARVSLEDCGDWVDGVAGASSVAVRALDPAWSVLVF